VTSYFAKNSTLSDLNETWYDVRGRRDIHDDMTFKVIRGQGQCQEQSPFETIFTYLHSGGTTEHRDFKFGTRVDHSKSQPTDDKLSLKGAWSCHMTHFKFLVP